MNTQQSTKKEKKSYYKKAVSTVYSFLSTLLMCMAVIFVLFVCFFRLAAVNGDSMYPTLNNGDKIIVSNFLYTPDYGDIITVGRMGKEPSSFIKRVIALEGDEIYIDFETNLITVNGEIVMENYSVYGSLSEQGDFSYPLTVPENCVFVLGDNRGNSLDSRFAQVGFVDENEITGKALFRIVPFGSANIY